MKYNDIINMPHHVSKKHPKMSTRMRSAQFAPFAALSGYGEAIGEASRIVDKKTILTNEEKIMIGDKLRYIEDNLLNRVEVVLVCFVCDNYKDGGKYVNIKGVIRKIDLYNHKIIFTDKSNVDIDNIVDIYL